MEAFRNAVLNYKPFQDHFLDDMAHMKSQDDDKWHDIFTDYHELALEHGHVAVAMVSDGNIVDDVQFIVIESHTAIDMGLEPKLKR